ncbi:MAG TPA: hypothetical protein VGV64_03185 [Thermoplasmata archaeon]|nr:hypothetical protein [Thermoplasmata archaeon]
MHGDRAFAPHARSTSPDPDRLERGERYWRAAQRLRDGALAPVLPFVLALGVTGSSAYREPEAGDDLDLLAITRPGTLWIVLAYAYLALRFGRGPGPLGEPSTVCLNYVRDAPAALREFSQAQDFLFAREALTVRLLVGEAFYARLLASAPWMAREVPRLYGARRDPSGPQRLPKTSLALRGLNALLFLGVSTYLQLQGLRRNAHLRRRGATDDVFRSVTRLGSLSFDSTRFERRRAGYAAPDVSPTPGGEGPRPADPSQAARAPRSPAPGG